VNTGPDQPAEQRRRHTGKTDAMDDLRRLVSCRQEHMLEVHRAQRQPADYSKGAVFHHFSNLDLRLRSLRRFELSPRPRLETAFDRRGQHLRVSLRPPRNLLIERKNLFGCCIDRYVLFKLHCCHLHRSRRAAAAVYFGIMTLWTACPYSFFDLLPPPFFSRA